MDNTSQPDLLDQVAGIVSAYVSNNAISATDLPGLIASTHAALRGLGTPPTPEPEPLVPAVSIKRSVQDDFIVCLEDGKKFKSLKRHLSKLGMTPEQYRAKWSLPADYPMVAPSYSAARSQMAKSIGLGRKPDAGATPAKTGRKPRTAKADGARAS